MADNEPTAEEQAAAAAAAAAAATAKTTPDPAAQLAETRAALAAATDRARQAIQTANPDLPPSAFTGDDIAAIDASVAAARTIADHAVAAFQATQPKTVTVAGAGTTRQPVAMPDGLTGVRRIGFALNNPGPGMTE